MERKHKRINLAKKNKLIAAYRLPLSSRPAGSPAPVQADGDLNGAVINNSVFSFVAGMSRLNKEYTRKSYLLASSYVSDVLKVGRGTQAWYDEFIKVMGNLGWLPIRSSFERVTTSGKGLSVQVAALNIITSTVASTFLSGSLAMVLPKLAADAFDALKQLSAPFDLFKRNIVNHEGGDFGLASCSEVDGEVLMVLVTYSAQGVSKKVGVPFFEWDSSTVEAYSGQTCLMLNPAVVNDATLQQLRESAGDKALLAIAQYRI
ncbi:hypothetical protein [Pseudomonas shahriarae]|uniref:Virulence factor Evf domain-containing protein n=1 Tax=Pseudomonas shahriarae TaxID=2745512 RepID=A0ABT5NJT4_9PSED|nr:hypothetical protein [Pseudomonas shahriarae]MDD0988499.1 hypothetical protein [Pseudomonas shahriarae]MDD1034499.1 hypothetical protein [Pseudomonas shahriarae]